MRKKQMTAGVLFAYLSIGFKLLSGILYTPILLHSLGQSEYGIYSLSTSFIGYLTILNSGMNAAYIRFYVQSIEKGERDPESINGIFLKIYLLLGIIGMAGGLLISGNAEFLFGTQILPNEYSIFKRSLRILSLTVLATTLNAVFTSCILAHERFAVGKLIDLLHTVLLPIITIPFLIAGFGSVTVITINLFLTILMLIANSLYAFTKLHMRFDLRYRDSAFLKSVMVFAGFIGLQLIMDQLNWQIDKFILARFKGSNEVAVYSVGSTFNTYFMTIAGAVSGMFIPQINRLVAKGSNEELSDLFIRTTRIFAQVAVLIMSGFLFFGEPFIARWAGQEYTVSYYVGLLIMLPVTFSLSIALAMDITRAKNLHKTQIVLNTLCAFLNFAISIPLAKAYGAIGSALGTFVCEIVIAIFVNAIYYHKVVKLNMIDIFKELLKLIPGWLPPFIVGAALMYFRVVQANYLSIILYGCLYVAVYGVSVWLISLSNKEKQYMKSMFKRSE